MEKTNHNSKNEHEGHFYKGLFFGLLIGAGMIWFLNSEGGRELVKTARKKFDEALAAEPGLEDYDEDTVEPSEPKAESSSSQDKTPRRFFQKKSK